VRSASMKRSYRTTQSSSEKTQRITQECPFCKKDLKTNLPKHIMSCRRRYDPIYAILHKKKPSRPNLEKVFGNRRGQAELKNLAAKHKIDINLMNEFIEAMYECHLLGQPPKTSVRGNKKRKSDQALVPTEEPTQKATIVLRAQLQLPHQRLRKLLQLLSEAKQADNIGALGCLDKQYPGSPDRRQFVNTESFWLYRGNDLIIETVSFLGYSKNYRHRRFIERCLFLTATTSSKYLLANHNRDDRSVTGTRFAAFHAIVSNHALEHGSPVMKSWLSRTIIATYQYPLPPSRGDLFHTEKLFGKRLVSDYIPHVVRSLVLRGCRALDHRLGVLQRGEGTAWKRGPFAYHPLLYFCPSREGMMLKVARLAKLHAPSSSFPQHSGNSNSISRGRAAQVLCTRELQQRFPHNESSIEFVNQAMIKLPPSLLLLTRLKEMNLSYNYLQSLPDSICQLRCLTRLDVGSNGLESLPASVGDLACLESLFLENNRLTSLPGTIGNLQRLRILHLHDNRLTSLPGSIGEMSGLQGLQLRHNSLMNLPSIIGKLSSLRYLHLGHNYLTALPATIGNLSELRRLYLHDNSLESLPARIAYLSRLEKLCLEGNRLTSIPESIGKLAELRCLHLQHNYLENLPAAIARLSRLEKLHLEDNHLISLPHTVGNLAGLESLYLHNNRLTSLPATVAKLLRLERLHLEGNCLVSLPKMIGNLPALRRLQLEHNRLVSVPASIQNLSRIGKLRLDLPPNIGLLEPRSNEEGGGVSLSKTLLRQETTRDDVKHEEEKPVNLDVRSQAQITAETLVAMHSSIPSKNP